MDNYQDPEYLEIWFATYEDIEENGITAPTWEDNSRLSNLESPGTFGQRCLEKTKGAFRAGKPLSL